MTVSTEKMEKFLKGQIAAWNAGDKDAFMGLYREMSPNGLDIDYVGRPRRDAWEILETMWAEQIDRIELEVLKKIINGTEAACLHRNKVRNSDMYIDTIELYAFGEGTLSIRYFIAPVSSDA